MSSECAVLAAFPINYWPCRYFPLYYWPAPVGIVEDYLLWSYLNLIELSDINMNTLCNLNSDLKTVEEDMSILGSTVNDISSDIVTIESKDSIIVLEENEDS